MFWKIVGLIGGACLAPFTGGTSLAASIAVCGGIGLTAGYLLDENEDKKRKENEKLALAGKAGEAITGQVNNIQNARSEKTSQLNTLEQQIQQKRNKLNDPNTSEQEKIQIKSELASLVAQSDRIRKDIENYDKQIEDLLKNIPTGDNKKGGLINLESMDQQTKLIAGAIVFLVIYFSFVKEKEG